MKHFLLLCLCCTTVNLAISQQTVGLFSNTEASYNGYTLFAPMSSNETYLINNCGEKVHAWTSGYKPGTIAYLLKNGTLLRARTLRNLTFNAGGSGGGIEMLDWDGKVIWEYTVSSTLECQHHDIEYLPNGNILVLSWDLKSPTEASQAGRSNASTVWSEKIIEIKPNLLDGSGTVVWEWKAWDHLVQNVDTSKDNYGVINDSPQLINVNYISSPGADWLHMNSITYNEALDQIMLSVLNFNEIFIIDHSTSTAEAASHSGGNSGMGGDLLYRWGNPAAYNQGGISQKKLFGQHHATWITASYPDGNKILLFNNRAGGTQQYSTVNIIEPPIDSTNHYTYKGVAFEPLDFYWTYKAPNPTDFYAINISGVQRLPNGNTLICEGTTGRFFEIDENDSIVWEYISPVKNNGIIANQGDNPAGNLVFRCERYPVNYPGLSGHTLSSQGYLESGSTFDCKLYNEVNSYADYSENLFNVYPNPSTGTVTLQTTIEQLGQLEIYTIQGKLVFTTNLMGPTQEINLPLNLNNGLYFIKLISNGTSSSQKILLKRE